ncbi:MAG: hypothetical protein F4060_15260 [Holophagales bacterium]|nr:hypothetical protein [Holophagales bacterium]MYG30844.1 hypothetical protein [Holophagales bacterium]MYI81289.1 hypothetical protein [Holophagales bacterium]
MKHILVAVAFCALPATALAQGVVCQACDHVAPYYRGEGGFIATVAEGADEVVFVASCGNVTTTGEVGTGGGTVAQLFTFRNGLACDRDDGSLEIAGVEDGGWYWITDAANSAVGSLIGKDALDNEPTAIANAGPGVSMTMGKGAVFLKETATGRVGILPNILPEPRPPDAVLCGPRYDAVTESFSDQQASSCMLGDGGTKIRLLGPGAHGRRGMITSGVVTRPATGDLVVNADLWVDESGSYSTADPITPALGWIGKGGTAGTNWLSTTFTVTVDNPPPGVDAAAALTGANVVVTDAGSGSTPAGQATITISASPDNYCPARGSQTTAVLNILAAVDGTNANNLHPATSALSSSGALASFTAATQLQIVCPPAQ